MSETSTMDVLFYLLLLILPLSALVAQRLPIGQVAKMAAAWLAIFAVLLLVVAQRDRLRPVWSFLSGEDRIVTGATMRIPMSADGHFWVDARINGRAVRLLIDSGATSTSLGAETATLAGVAVESGFATAIDTANGRVIANRGIVQTLQFGQVSARDLPVMVSAAFGDTNVLGMNFLSRLRGWRVEGRTLILDPHPA